MDMPPVGSLAFILFLSDKRVIFPTSHKQFKIWNLFIELMNMLYIGIYGVHSMELIYYIKKLEFVATPADEQAGQANEY